MAIRSRLRGDTALTLLLLAVSLNLRLVLGAARVTRIMQRAEGGKPDAVRPREGTAAPVDVSPNTHVRTNVHGHANCELRHILAQTCLSSCPRSGACKLGQVRARRRLRSSPQARTSSCTYGLTSTYELGCVLARTLCALDGAPRPHDRASTTRPGGEAFRDVACFTGGRGRAESPFRS